jgi:hypothetical protein
MDEPKSLRDIIAQELKKADGVITITSNSPKPYRENTRSLDTQRANDVQYGGDHYKKMNIQPWDVIDCWSFEQQVGYHRGNILKYTMRMGSKDERIKEAKKIRHYAEKLIEVLEKEYGNDPRGQGKG